MCPILSQQLICAVEDLEASMDSEDVMRAVFTIHGRAQ